MPIKTKKCCGCGSHYGYIIYYNGQYLCYLCYQNNYKNR